ncbi:MAG: hypothetical protein ACC661_10470, partial [Verrucomicrobiales bacterium]
VTVENPPDWEGGGRLAYLDHFETSIGLAELLDLEIDIDDITVTGLELTLEEDSEGRGNWDSLTGSGEAELDPKPEVTGELEDDERPGLDLGFTGFDFLSVSDLSITRKVGGVLLGSGLAIDFLNGSALAGQPVQLAVTGSIRGLPFEGTFLGGTLGELLAGTRAWPLEIDLDLRDASLRLDGDISAADMRFPEGLEVALDIPDIGRLEPLTGPVPLAGSLRIEGRAFNDRNGRYRISELIGEIAGAEMSGLIELDLRAEPPRLEGEISIGKLDIAPQLAGDPGQEEGDEPDPEKEVKPSPGPAQDEPPPGAGDDEEPSLLPIAGDFTLRIDTIVGLPATVHDLVVDLDTDSRSAVAEVTVNFADAPFSGRLEVRREETEHPVAMALTLDGKDADLTKIAHLYLGDQRFQGRFERGHYEITGNGDNLADCWKGRKVDLKLDGAAMSYKGEGKHWKFFMETSRLHRDFGSTGEISANGTISDADYELHANFHLPTDASFGEVDEVSGRVADVEFEVRNITGKDADNPYSHLEYTFKGERLDRLDRIYELDLPPLGPYSVSGTIDYEGDGIEIEKLEITVGESRLLADLRFDRKAVPPKLKATLNAETIQLDDFSTAGWSPTGSEVKKNSSPTPSEPASLEDLTVLPRALPGHK